MIQRSKQRYRNMLWNMRSITRHKRSYGHPLHPDLTPDVLTCVLPLGTVSSGREIEVESAHLFLTIIQFLSACHLTSSHTSTCIHNSIISHSPMQSVHTLLKLAQLRWTGHVTRMPDERLPKKVLYGELQEGKRSQGGQKKRYKDTLKASLKDFNIPIESWEQAAQDRTKWRCLINKGASQFEEKRICEAERKRKERKGRAKEASSVSAQSEFTCSICNRQFRAKIGLYSHHRTHKHT